jgi:hypothetical protein
MGTWSVGNCGNIVDTSTVIYDKHACVYICTVPRLYKSAGAQGQHTGGTEGVAGMRRAGAPARRIWPHYMFVTYDSHLQRVDASLYVCSGGGEI